MRWIIFFIVLSTTLLFAQDDKSQQEKKQPTLAELAKKAREKKAGANAPARVITNADLKGLRSNVATSSTPATSEDATAEGAAAAAESPSSGQPTEEDMAKWQEAFQQSRVDLQNAVSEGLVLQLRLNNLRNSFLQQSDGATQQRVQAQMAETLEAIETNKQTQQDARRAISQLQRDARGAGLTGKQISDLTGKLPEANPEILTPETSTGG